MIPPIGVENRRCATARCRPEAVVDNRGRLVTSKPLAKPEIHQSIGENHYSVRIFQTVEPLNHNLTQRARLSIAEFTKIYVSSIKMAENKKK